MKVLITGGAGFIGSHLTKYFLDKNHQVYVIDNLITGKKYNLNEYLNNQNLVFIEKNIVNFSFYNLPSFDIIYDLASPASPKIFEKLSIEILKVNSFGLFNLLNFFLKSKSKVFVFASTSEVYGDPLVSPQKETYFGNVNPNGIRSVYDEGKRFAEATIFAYIRKHYLDIRIARIFNTYGPFMSKDDGRVISNFINQALTNQPITVYGDGQQTRSCCYIDDMIEGLIKIGVINNLQGQVINLGNPEEKKIIDIALLIKKLTDSKSKIFFQPLPEDDPKQRLPDIEKAKNLLDWTPKINLRQGLIKTINYFKNN